MPISPIGLRKQLIERTGICLKAIINGQVAGIIYAQPESPIHAKEGLEKWLVANIAVVPSQTSKGIGSKLLNAIEKIAKRKGVKKIFVHTNDSDDRVIRFYKKNGYKDAGYIKDYYYSGSAIFLIKYLI